MSQKLQPILGTDTCDPYFTVYVSTDNDDDLHVYFGLALLERVNRGTEGFQYKYLLARLYNGGFKRKKLVEAFNHSVGTLRRWGDAVRSGDIEKILSAFSGQGAECRLTQEIENFIRSEFKRVYPENNYSYSKIIIERVKEIFDEEFSSERLRPIFNELKEEFAEGEVTRTNECLSSAVETNTCSSEDNLSVRRENIRNYSVSNSEYAVEGKEPLFVHHIGLIIALYMIDKMNIEENLVRQWLVSVLSGCANLEQTESLDFSSLEYLLGHPFISTAYNQHTALKKLSIDENRLTVFKLNAQLINAAHHQYYYYDPHSVKYTGMKNILKGWCGSMGKITKVNYQDFFHTPDGDPVYFEINDNYSDMRERFTSSVKFFSEEILKSPGRTFIIDRGIYGEEKMLEIDKMQYGLVTWEKGYKKNAWDENKAINEFKIHRRKNHSEDIRTWDVKFFKDEAYSKIPGFYRLIVKITPPGKEIRTLEVSVLSNGRLDDGTAVFAMLNRWIQENDFKYMIRHFGLNEITSYQALEYVDIRELLSEKNVVSESYKKLEQAHSLVRAKLKELLLKKHTSQTVNETLKTEINACTAELKMLACEKKTLNRHESKIDKLISENKCRLLADKKAFLDAVKITARNIFYLLSRIFRPIYNNYRNDHQILRELLRSHGTVIPFGSFVKIELDVTRNFQPEQLKKIKAFLSIISDNINASTQSAKPIKLDIRQRKVTQFQKLQSI